MALGRWLGDVIEARVVCAVCGVETGAGAVAGRGCLVSCIVGKEGWVQGCTSRRKEDCFRTPAIWLDVWMLLACCAYRRLYVWASHWPVDAQRSYIQAGDCIYRRDLC